MHFFLFKPSSNIFEHQPLLLSFRTTSDISNSFRGRGIFLLAAIVFSRPGSSVVRATWWRKTAVNLKTWWQFGRWERAPSNGKTSVQPMTAGPLVLCCSKWLHSFIVLMMNNYTYHQHLLIRVQGHKDLLELTPFSLTMTLISISDHISYQWDV